MGSGIDDYAKAQFARELDATIADLLRDADTPTNSLKAGTCPEHSDIVLRQKRQAKASAMTLSILRETHGHPRKMVMSSRHVAGISTIISGVVIGIIEAMRSLAK